MPTLKFLNKINKLFSIGSYAGLLLAATAGAACGRPLPDSALTVVSSPAPTAIVTCDVVPLGKTASGVSLI